MKSIVLRILAVIACAAIWFKILAEGFGDYVLYGLGVRDLPLAQATMALCVPAFVAAYLFRKEFVRGLARVADSSSWSQSGSIRPLFIILGYLTMIFAAPASQLASMTWVVNNTQAGFNSTGGLWALVAVCFGWIPGAALGGAIAAVGARDGAGSVSHFQLVTALGIFPTLVSCATVTSPF